MNNLTSEAADRLFVDKVFEYVADPGFSATVETYLRTMVDEYELQREQHHILAMDPRISGPGRQHHANLSTIHEARRAAYADALRVLDDAVQAALDFAQSAVRYDCNVPGCTGHRQVPRQG